MELKDGRWLGMGRTVLNRLFQCISEDQGETWEKVRPTQLASGDTPCIIRRIPKTDDLLVIWNQTSSQEWQCYLTRHRLSSAISRDEGKTWESFKNLESLDDVPLIELSEIKRFLGVINPRVAVGPTPDRLLLTRETQREISATGFCFLPMPHTVTSPSSGRGRTSYGAASLSTTVG